MGEPTLAQKVEALRQSSVFGALPAATIEQLAGAMWEFEAPAGQVLIERGQSASGLFVIVEGCVEVDAPVYTRECHEGEVVGELALLTRDGKRTARVRAKTDVRCLTLDRVAFEEALATDPRIGLALLDVVAARLADMPGLAE